MCLPTTSNCGMMRALQDNHVITNSFDSGVIAPCCLLGLALVSVSLGPHEWCSCVTTPIIFQYTMDIRPNSVRWPQRPPMGKMEYGVPTFGHAADRWTPSLVY